MNLRKNLDIEVRKIEPKYYIEWRPGIVGVFISIKERTLAEDFLPFHDEPTNFKNLMVSTQSSLSEEERPTSFET